MKKSSYRTQNQRGNFSRTKTKIHNQPTQIDSETCKREQKIRAETKISKKENKKQFKKESKNKKKNQKIAKTKRKKEQKQKEKKKPKTKKIKVPKIKLKPR